MVQKENRCLSEPCTAVGKNKSGTLGKYSGDISGDGGKRLDAKNCLIVSGPIRKPGQGESEMYAMRTFDNTRDFDSAQDRKAATLDFSRGQSRLVTFVQVLGSALALLGGLYGLYYNLGTTNGILTTLLFGVPVASFLLVSNARPKQSKRIIKWTLDEFSEEREYFFTSPAIRDMSGFWRIVLRQSADEETTFGLIVTDKAKDIRNVVASVEISVTIGGLDIVPDLSDIKFVHCYECEGDCGYSAPIRIALDQLKHHKMYIKCQIQFSRREVPNFQKVLNYLTLIFGPEEITQNYYSRSNEKLTRSVEIGSILPEPKFCTGTEILSSVLTGTELEGNIASFIKHPQTRTFLWKIPQFSKHLKNVECWTIFSPNLFVNSHGFCSIWRLQLVELQGIFRLHLQLRGLPSGISKIKLRHLAELTDNFGDHIVPKHSGSSIQYPDFLRLWDTHRSSLYRRETILERFVTIDDILTIRISLHCEPNDSVKIECESASAGDWILHN